MIHRLFLCFFIIGPSIISYSQENEPLPPKEFPESEITDCGEPYYTGGTQAMFTYLKSNLMIPDSCIKSTTDSKLYVKLLVDSSGSVTKVEFLKADFLSEECKDRISKVFYTMPGWNPGMTNGKKTSRYITLPIRLEFD